jgi:hypothetical protein
MMIGQQHRAMTRVVLRVLAGRTTRAAVLTAGVFIAAVGVVALPTTAQAANVPSGSGPQAWHTQKILNSDNELLTGVSCSAGNACTAVGQVSYGQSTGTLAQRWSGTGWTPETTVTPSGGYGGFLSSVSCLSTSYCEAVGQYNNSDESTYAPLAEIWNGSAWAVQVAPAPPNPGPATGSGFYSVSCTSPEACTAVGYAPSENFSKPEVTLVETWNGSAWQEQAGPVRGGQLNGISCLSTSFCMAVGTHEPSSGPSDSLIELWNGSDWAIQPSPEATNSSLDSVSCTSSTACTAVGTTQVGTAALAESWNGKRWSVDQTPAPAGGTSSQLTGVSCSSSDACTAVGAYNLGPRTEDNLAEKWNGESWTVQATADAAGAPTSLLESVSCVSPTNCSAVGYSNSSDLVPSALAEAERP